MKNDFFLAFSELLEDKQLPKEVVIDALEAAMVSAYRKTVNASSAQQIKADFDLESGGVTIYAEKEVVDEVQDERTEVTLEKAQAAEPEAELGSIVIVESTPDDFGRVAAQTARQVIQQRIREAERQAQHDHFKTLEGEIINGIVQAMNPGQITLG
ncbi:MAG TPA: NusA N-terminal domain-containing protein, partial [Anaerolineales bacterium]|nr:NusA N-terminal domain-containing protein [Anaerolineales bacterium]